MKIKFIDTIGVPEEYQPKPAQEIIPDWYKQSKSYVSGIKKPLEKGITSATIKRCMPVFDAISGGYIITSYTDIFISQREETYPNGKTASFPWYQWPSLNPIEFHSVDQAPIHPQRNGHDISYPKWINPWAIQTPKGYSSLFIQPMHRESVFTILPGIVDTDTYTAPVNFPFVLNDINFEGIIPAGTPIAQVIPFKRDSWEMEIGDEKDFIGQAKVSNKLRTKFFDSYKSQFRSSKEYR